jgi:hypothetical protein
MTRLVKGYNMQQRTGTKINFQESYDELTLVFWPKRGKSLFSMKIRTLEKQGLFGAAADEVENRSQVTSVVLYFVQVSISPYKPP